MYINGRWMTTDETMDVINPATGEAFTKVYALNAQHAVEAVEAAYRSFPSWARLTAAERASYMEQVIAGMTEKREALARAITLEMGKSIHNSRYEVDSAIQYFKWFAEEAKRVYGETIPPSLPNKRLMAIKQPVGVVAAITPWNFPLSMAARKLGPALAAGCTVVLKPSAEAPVSSVELFRIFDECGIPPGVVNLVTGRSKEVTDPILDSGNVRKISFTGSTEVGKLLLRRSADTVKRVSMELGGHAPYIVFDDADLDLAVEGAITIKFGSTGQQCASANRLYIQDGIYEDFASRYAKRVSELRVGNGLDESVNMGPLINEQAVAKVQSQVDDALSKGAKVLLGGKRLTNGEYSKGFFYPPTLLKDVADGMDIVTEETFGPVAPLIRFTTEDEVVEKANATNYGLASYLFTNDLSRMYRVMERLEFGIVGVNDAYPFVVQGPFGGMKESGMGREGGRGIEDYVETKFVSIRIDHAGK